MLTSTPLSPQTFRHSNFSSFVRQLNKYGFSKIKRVDEDTGQIKENIWEFQHPNFQAGGKSALEAIKRKTAAPKKGPTRAENETSPSGARSGRALAAEDSTRLVELENKVLELEDRCMRTMDKLREWRNWEASATLLFREVIGVLAAREKEAPGPSMGANDKHSPRVMQLDQLYDQLIQPNPNYYPMLGAMPFQAMDTARGPGMSTSLQGGVAPSSPQIDGSGDIVDAVATRATQLINPDDLGNPLAAMGWSDETYQVVLQFLATGVLPDASPMQANGKSVDDARLQGDGSGNGAQIPVLPSGSPESHAFPQIHQLPTHQQGHLGHQQSQSQSAGLVEAIGTNELFEDNSGFGGAGVGVKRGFEAVED